MFRPLREVFSSTNVLKNMVCIRGVFNRLRYRFPQHEAHSEFRGEEQEGEIISTRTRNSADRKYDAAYIQSFIHSVASAKSDS
jgi:hypothetical protein